MSAEPNLAREVLYRFLAAALRDPQGPGGELVREPLCRAAAGVAADLLREHAPVATRLGFGELPPASLDLQSVLSYLERPEAEWHAEYYRVFGLLPARECQPYETEYHTTEEPFFRAQQMADVAGFYRAFGLEPSHAAPERPDYLPLELEFMAFLLLKQRLAVWPEDRLVCEEAQVAFFRDHLAWWVPSFAVGLRCRAGSGPYAALADVLAALMATERARFDTPPPCFPLATTQPEPAEEPADCAGCSA